VHLTSTCERTFIDSLDSRVSISHLTLTSLQPGDSLQTDTVHPTLYSPKAGSYQSRVSFFCTSYSFGTTCGDSLDSSVILLTLIAVEMQLVLRPQWRSTVSAVARQRRRRGGAAVPVSVIYWPARFAARVTRPEIASNVGFSARPRRTRRTSSCLLLALQLQETDQ